MKLVALAFSFVFCIPGFADQASSKKIQQAVDMIRPLAESGVTKYKVKASTNVKEVLLALALKNGNADDASDFSWVGSDNSAWETDSGNWGSTTMKGAYDYVTEIDKDYFRELEPKEKEKILKNVQKAKEAFKLLLKTGVIFGIAPLGAVQCGVTFAALAIIDPNTGIVYIFAKEGSGC